MKPDEVRHALGSDQNVVRLLADALEGRNAPTARTTGLVTRPEGEKDVKITMRKKPTPAKPKKPTSPKKSPAKAAKTQRTPRGPKVSIQLAVGADATREAWPTPPRPGTTQPVARSVHDLAETTPCHTCGGPCDTADDRHGPWRRHRECSRLGTRSSLRLRAAALSLSAIELADDVAEVADLFVPLFSDGRTSARYLDTDADRTAWNHVRLRDISRSVMMAKRLIAEAAEPVADEWGRCCWCGIDVSLMWAERGHKWLNGSPAALCSDCGAVYDRRGRSAQFWDDQRTGMVEAITGVPPMMGESAPAGLLAYAEVENGGDGTHWSHLPADAVKALRWDRWARSNGRYAPPEHRAEALARRAVQEAARARRVAESMQGDPYGFHDAQEGEKP